MSVSNQNVVPPFDPTGYSAISGAKLKQLIDGIKMFADKGLVIETTDTSLGVPDVPAAQNGGGQEHLQRCMWRRITPSSVVPYLWVQASVDHSEGGNDIKKWYSLNQLAGLTSNITTNQIADGAVTDAKVNDSGISVKKIIGNISTNPTLAAGVIMDTTAAGGDLEGTYPNPTVKVGAVDAASLADHSIADIKMEIGDLTHGLQLDKLKAVGATGDQIQTGAGPAFLWEKFTPKKIVNLADPTSATDVGKVVRVKNPYTAGFELAPNNGGQILQRRFVSEAGGAGVVLTNSASLTPTYAAGTITGLTMIGSSRFMPVSPSSTIHFSIRGKITHTGTGGAIDGNGVIALFADSVALAAQAPVAINVRYLYSDYVSNKDMIIEFDLASSATFVTNGIFIAVRAWGTNGTSTWMISTYTPPEIATMEVIEYL